MERTSRTVNLLNVFEQETFWINIIVIVSLLIKDFLRRNINVFIHIFFVQLFLSRFTLYWSEKLFRLYSKIRLCTTTKKFLNRID